MKTKEPKKLDFSMKGGKPSKLVGNEEKRMKRKAALLTHFNKFQKVCTNFDLIIQSIFIV
jgi:hypothetical protein